jgi:urea transport system ATP-binding protein
MEFSGATIAIPWATPLGLGCVVGGTQGRLALLANPGLCWETPLGFQDSNVGEKHYKQTHPLFVMLTIKNLSVSLGGSRILRDVSLRVPAGKVFCLMGRNGTGKTTLLKTVMGLYPADEGSLIFNGATGDANSDNNGVEIIAYSTEKRARAGIAYVPQGRGIFPHLTVGENLIIGAVAQGKKQAETRERVFMLFPILKDFLKRKGGMLSGGQQQQLAIGRALLTQPKLLLLDEPTEGIQPNIIAQIGETIKLLRADGITVLLVEQYLDFCKELADNFAILDRGAIVASGPAAALTPEVIKTCLTV